MWTFEGTASVMSEIALTRRRHLWSYPPMIRVHSHHSVRHALGAPAPSFAQKPATGAHAPAIIRRRGPRGAGRVERPGQTRRLRRHVERHHQGATCPASTPGRCESLPRGTPAGQAKPPPTETTVEGLKIPLAPDSLGAQVLLSASAFVNHLGTQAMDALRYSAKPAAALRLGRDGGDQPDWPAIFWSMSPGGWRSCWPAAAAVEYGLRRAMRRPIRGLEGLAPRVRSPHRKNQRHRQIPTKTTMSARKPMAASPHRADEPAVARAEAGGDRGARATPPAPVGLDTAETRAPGPRPLVLGTGPGAWHRPDRTPDCRIETRRPDHSRLIILAVVDAYAICVALLCLARMLLSPEASRLRLFHLPGCRRHLPDVLGAAADPDRRAGLRDRRGRPAAGSVRYRPRRLGKRRWPRAAPLSGIHRHAEPPGRAPLAARARRRRRHGCPPAQPLCPGLALGRAVLPGRRLADLGDRSAARLRCGAALFHRHRPGADRCAIGSCCAAGHGGPSHAARTRCPQPLPRNARKAESLPSGGRPSRCA